MCYSVTVVSVYFYLTLGAALDESVTRKSTHSRANIGPRYFFMTWLNIKYFNNITFLTIELPTLTSSRIFGLLDIFLAT